MSVTANTDTSDRSSTVTVKADELTATLTVTQRFNREGNWYVEIVPQNRSHLHHNVSDNGKMGRRIAQRLHHHLQHRSRGSRLQHDRGEEGMANQIDVFDISDDGIAVRTCYEMPSEFRNGEWQQLDTQRVQQRLRHRHLSRRNPLRRLCRNRQQLQTGTLEKRTDRIPDLSRNDLYGSRKPMPDREVKSMSADGTCVGADWTDQLGCYWDKQGQMSCTTGKAP